jgi:hypothetical protein
MAYSTASAPMMIAMASNTGCTLCHKLLTSGHGLQAPPMEA